jgi:hypothetical protein
MTSDINERSQYLRRSIAPYVGQIVILSLLTIGVLFISIKRHAWGLLLPVPVLWSLFAFLSYLGLKYKINWADNDICQEASGGKEVHIRYGDITGIKLEMSKPGELLAASRPFRRIAIYASERQGAERRIDVSLKHFLADDVREFMRVIQLRRPDLVVPEEWRTPGV